MVSKAYRLMHKGFIPILVFLSAMFLLGCSENTPFSEGTSSETGAIAFNILLEDEGVDTAGTTVSRAISDECGTANPAQIWRVAATVYSTPNISGFWECTDGQGTLANVPPGNDLRLVIIAYNAVDFGNISVYSGETNVNVAAGQTARPTIIAENFSVDKGYPGQNATGVNPVSITFQWDILAGANGYLLQVADRMDLSDPNVVLFINQETQATRFKYDAGLAENTTYYWGVFPIDIAGDSAYGSVWSFTTGSGAPITDVNLTSYTRDWGDPDIDVFFRLSDNTLNWGDTVDARFAVTNDGSEDIPADAGIWVRVYLSTDNIINGLDYELEYRVFGYSLQSGFYIYQLQDFPWPLTLPSLPPPGFTDSGEFYIGVVIDPEYLVIETDEGDNSNMGEYRDYVPVFISP